MHLVVPGSEQPLRRRTRRALRAPTRRAVQALSPCSESLAAKSGRPETSSPRARFFEAGVRDWSWSPRLEVFLDPNPFNAPGAPLSPGAPERERRRRGHSSALCALRPCTIRKSAGWQIQALHMGLPYDEVAEHLCVSLSSLKRWVWRYESTGTVARARQAGRRRKLSMAEEVAIIERVLDSPTITMSDPSGHKLILDAPRPRRPPGRHGSCVCVAARAHQARHAACSPDTTRHATCHASAQL